MSSELLVRNFKSTQPHFINIQIVKVDKTAQKDLATDFSMQTSS